VVNHKCEREGAGKSDKRGEGLGEEVDHWDGESPEYEGDDTKVSFWFGKRIELMGKNKKKGRVKEGWAFSVEPELAFKIIPGIIKCVYLIHP
jgi:hypothetical protein